VSAPAAGYPPALGELRYLDDAERERLLGETLAAHAPRADFWLFAYGSLIWRPDLPVIQTVSACVHGYHRGLCLWSCVSRGTPEAPGLVLALDEGGRCQGVVHRLAPEGLETSLRTLWARELVMDSYRPVWLDAELADGRRVKALGFAMRPGAPNYAGRVSDAVVREMFRCASGRHGSALEYLRQTVGALREHGIRDPDLEGLLQRCG
jgi:cation transport protein ChaC